MQKIFHRVRFSVSVSAIITFLLGLGLTALLFSSVRKVESERQKVQFQQNANLRIAAVDSGLQDAVEQLVVLNQLFRTVGAISREQFHVFTTPLLERYPQIQALSFQRLIMHADRQAYETVMRRHNPDFMITEIIDGVQQRAFNRDSYNVVDYIEPLAGNEAALGLNTLITPDQMTARTESRNTGHATATGLLSLAQRKGWHTGFLVLAPVYLQGALLDTASARQRSTIGETAAVFRVDHLLDTILGNGGFLNLPGMTISVYSSSWADQKNLAFQHGEDMVTSNHTSLFPSWLLFDQSTPVSKTFTIAEKPWHIEIAQAANFLLRQTTAHCLCYLVAYYLVCSLPLTYMSWYRVQRQLSVSVTNVLPSGPQRCNLQIYVYPKISRYANIPKNPYACVNVSLKFHRMPSSFAVQVRPTLPLSTSTLRLNISRDITLPTWSVADWNLCRVIARINKTSKKFALPCARSAKVTRYCAIIARMAQDIGTICLSPRCKTMTE
jgi:CHASE1-domain containing sensor protein